MHVQGPWPFWRRIGFSSRRRLWAMRDGARHPHLRTGEQRYSAISPKCRSARISPLGRICDVRWPIGRGRRRRRYAGEACATSSLCVGRPVAAATAKPTYFAALEAARTAAQRFFVASMIRCRPSALSFRFGFLAARLCPAADALGSDSFWPSPTFSAGLLPSASSRRRLFSADCARALAWPRVRYRRRSSVAGVLQSGH